MRTWKNLIVGLLFLLSTLVACASGKHPAVKSVEDYLQALVNRDEAKFLSHICPEFEEQALLEFDSFSLVKTRLEGVDCQVVEERGDHAVVLCKGAIIATYGSEDQSFELGEQPFQVTRRSGEWLVCGY